MDFYFLIHLASLCLLIGEFSLLIFKVIIGRYLLIAVLVLLVDAAVCAFSGTSYCSNYALVFLSTVYCLFSFLYSAPNNASCNFFRFDLLDINFLRLYQGKFFFLLQLWQIVFAEFRLAVIVFRTWNELLQIFWFSVSIEKSDVILMSLMHLSLYVTCTFSCRFQYFLFVLYSNILTVKCFFWSGLLAYCVLLVSVWVCLP